MKTARSQNHERALAHLAALVRDGKVGTAGFVRIRSTFSTRDLAGKGSLATRLVERLVGSAVIWLANSAGDPRHVFCQATSARGGTATALVTCTLDSGAIAELTATCAPGSEPRIECEVCGTDGLLRFDSADEVLLVRGVASSTCDSDPELHPAVDQVRHAEAVTKAALASLETGKRVRVAGTRP